GGTSGTAATGNCWWTPATTKPRRPMRRARRRCCPRAASSCFAARGIEEAPHRGDHRIGLVLVRRMAAVRQLQQARLRHAPRDAVDLLQRAVLVVDALDREQRAADRADLLLDRPAPEGRRQPDVVPAPE